MAKSGSDPSEREPEATVNLLWSEPGRPSRGPKPTLTLAQIAHAGIELADVDGLATLTMRRVAEHLGFTTMALYRHVRSKTELIAVMVDAAIGETLSEAAPPIPSITPWRPRLAAWAQQNFALFQRHPWLLQAAMPGALIGPNRIAWIEAGLRTLDDTGLPAHDRLEVVLFVYSYVHGTAHLSREWRQDESQAWLPTSPLMRRVRHDPRFPVLSSLLEDGGLDETEAEQAASDEASFAFGLARVLDGVAAYILHTARP